MISHSNHADPQGQKEALRVVAAAVIARDGRVLIAQRPVGKWQAGRWEFPGGKVEPGEDEETAVRRELMEELGVRVDAAQRLMEVVHDYTDRRVAIGLWLVLGFLPVPPPVVHSPLGSRGSLGSYSSWAGGRRSGASLSSICASLMP